MAPRSKVRDLPAELRAELDRLLREDRFTLDQVVAHLRQLAPDDVDLPSRSSVARYARKFEALSERMRRSKEIAERLVAEGAADVTDDKGLQVLLQGFQSLAFDRLASLAEDETPDFENLSFFARAINDVARARKTDADRALKIEQEARKKVIKEATEKLDQAVDAGEIAKEAAQAARRWMGFT